jgi:integrase
MKVINTPNAPVIVDAEGEIDGSVADWVFWMLENRMYSKNTVDSYVQYLNFFNQFLFYYYDTKIFKQAKELSDCITAFSVALRDGDRNLGWRTHSQSSLNTAMNALSSYLDYTDLYTISYSSSKLTYFSLETRRQKSFLKYGQASKLARMAFPLKMSNLPHYSKRRASLIKYFPPALIWEFIDAIPSHRDRAICLLMVGTSARIGQALNVWLDDIHWDDQKVIFMDPRSNERIKELESKYGLIPDPKIANKGPLPGVWLPGPLKERFFKEARLYYELEYVHISARAQMSPWFYVTATGKRQTPKAVWQLFTKIAKKLGIDDVSPHSLRHLYGYAAHIILGIDLETLRYNMGHKDRESTLIYASIPSDVAEERFREALENITKRARYSERQKASIIMLAKENHD